MITRAAAYRAIKGKPRDEQMAYMLSLGLNEHDAADFIDDYELRSAKYEQMVKDNEPFSQSERFRDMIEGFKSRIYGEK